MRILFFILLLITLMASGTVSANDDEVSVSLPPIDKAGEMPVERAIAKRRSVRDYRRGGLELGEISQLLWAAQGITDREGFRSAPSAGARYPIELYLVVGDVAGLEPGVYRYRAKARELVLVTSGDRRKPLASAALGQGWVRRAPAVLVIAGVFERTMDKYGTRGRRYVHMEVGAVAQNVYLQAETLGLGTVLVGAFHDREVREVLGIPSDHEALGLMPLGR